MKPDDERVGQSLPVHERRGLMHENRLLAWSVPEDESWIP